MLLRGIATVICCYPGATPSVRQNFRRRWSADVLDALGVRLDADVAAAPPGCLLVANHISWLDILVVNAVLPAAFVAKEEVRRWPVIGWLAEKNDTVFLRRGSRGHTRLINQEIATRLAADHHVAVFPEGTTSDGTRLLPFHAALIQPALAAGRPVVPLAISYWEPDGERSLAPRYDGDLSLSGCLRAILGRHQLIARLVAAPAVGLAGEDRRIVAAAARQSIASRAGLPPPSNRPEKPAGPPAVAPSDAPPRGTPNRGPGDWAASGVRGRTSGR